MSTAGGVVRSPFWRLFFELESSLDFRFRAHLVCFVTLIVDSLLEDALSSTATTGTGASGSGRGPSRSSFCLSSRPFARKEQYAWAFLMRISTRSW